MPWEFLSLGRFQGYLHAGMLGPSVGTAINQGMTYIRVYRKNKDLSIYFKFRMNLAEAGLPTMSIYEGKKGAPGTLRHTFTGLTWWNESCAEPIVCPRLFHPFMKLEYEAEEIYRKIGAISVATGTMRDLIKGMMKEPRKYYVKVITPKFPGGIATGRFLRSAFPLH
ncbi:hypothetical protein CLOM_g6711 [Closterium sp. NIES-68]|nr:hypothetical protein CLOM_g6711 [Closterium sp. NIES-68]